MRWVIGANEWEAILSRRLHHQISATATLTMPLLRIRETTTNIRRIVVRNAHLHIESITMRKWESAMQSAIARLATQPTSETNNGENNIVTTYHATPMMPGTGMCHLDLSYMIAIAGRVATALLDDEEPSPKTNIFKEHHTGQMTGVEPEYTTILAYTPICLHQFQIRHRRKVRRHEKTVTGIFRVVHRRGVQDMMTWWKYLGDS